MSESNNNIPMRITQLEEATAYEDGMFFAVAKAGSGTKKIKTNIPTQVDDDIYNNLYEFQGGINEYIKGTFQNGSLSYGIFLPQYKYRVTETDIISYNRDITISIKNGYKIALNYFEGGEFVSDSGWKTGTFEVQANKNFKMQIAKVTEDTSTTANIEEFKTAITINSIIKDISNKQTEIITSLTNLKPIIKFEIGGLLSTGQNYDNETWRIRSKTSYLENDIIITTNYGFRFMVYTFDDESLSNPISSGWINNGAEFIIPKHTYFRLLFSWIDHDSSSYAITDLYTSVQYNNIFIYSQYNKVYKTMQKMDSIKGYNPLCLSIAHQGYSNTEKYGRSKQESYVNAAYHGFDMGECDIKWSSDGVPVCCHDNSFVDSNDGTTVITISEHTVAELKTYGYYGGTIATLDEVVSTCKTYGLKVEIDQIAGDLSNTQWSTLLNIVSKYKMQDNILWSISVINSDDQRILSYYEKSKIVWNVQNTEDLASIIQYKFPYISEDAEYYLSMNANNITYNDIKTFNEQLDKFNVKVLVWTIDNLETYKNYLPYVDGIISNKLTIKNAMF